MFDEIVYINLDRRTDRHQHMRKQLHNFNVKIERMSAVDGRELDFENISKTLVKATSIKNVYENKKYPYMTRGGIGCALSHYNVYKRVVNTFDDNRRVLILEDDVWFDENFMEKSREMLGRLPEYDMLYMGYTHVTKIYEYNEYFVPKTVYGLFGYVINKKAAKNLMSMFPLTYQIDTDIFDTFPKMKTIALNKPLISSMLSDNNVLGTDIQIINKGDGNNIINDNIMVEILLIILILIVIIYGTFLAIFIINDT